MPEMFDCFWLFNSCAGSVFLIYHAVYLSPEFCGVSVVMRHLPKKKYFYKIIFVLLVNVAYIISLMSNDLETWRGMIYIFFIKDKFLTVILIFLLNFLPR